MRRVFGGRDHVSPMNVANLVGPRARARIMNFDIRETGRRIRARADVGLSLFFFGFASFGKFTTGLYHAGHSHGRDDISIGWVKAAPAILLMTSPDVTARPPGVPGTNAVVNVGAATSWSP